ncbi:MAG TPA: hypothetical protein VKF36_18380 [Syntrophorhabdales bacterium]|nr:hypothetical protein [Syntrophorhabdales bacterium]
MPDKDSIQVVESEIEEGMALKKCRHCGCMRDALENMRSSLSALKDEASSRLLGKVESLLTKTEETAYS